MTRCLLFVFLIPLIISCEDESVNDRNTSDQDQAPTLGLIDMASEHKPDIMILDWTPPPPLEPDMSPEERCALTSVLEVQSYCRCYPDCCQTQRWYCPPNPRQTIEAMQVIVEICGEDRIPCEFGVDEGCPPPEIISRSDCYVAHECQPGSTGEFLQWFECQLEDGRLGRQQVLCDKGRLIHGLCRPCDDEVCDGEDNDCDNITDEGRFPCQTQCGEGWGFCIEGQVVDCNAANPREEVCDFEDNDCDGHIDEGQRNICDTCGIPPPDDCDGEDNDCDGAVDEELIRECVTPCERGFETCDNGNWISCTARQPVDEICDGLDNDCDAQIDEQLECLCTIQDVGTLMPCSEPPLRCGQGFKTCECATPNCEEFRMTDCLALCSWVVQPPNAPPCDPFFGMPLANEECNNFDEDCDALIDEGLQQACYTGEPDTLLVGVCTPGEVVCRAGVWGNERDANFEPGYCLGEVTPSPEICNGADDDCDGEVDYGEEIRDTDVLFIVDWSGSMDDEIIAVLTALNRFAQHFAAEDPLQWGLVIGPKKFPASLNEMLVLVSDIAPFNQFLAAFAALGNAGMDTGDEMLLDALYFVLRNISANANVDIAVAQWSFNTGSIPEKENFIINWRENADRIIIVFSDEEEKSYLNPKVTSQQVQDAAAGALNTKVYTFSTGAFNDWPDIARAGSGRNFPLSSNAVNMYNDLMSIIDEACLPRPEQGAMLDQAQYMLVALYNVHYDYVTMECF